MNLEEYQEEVQRLTQGKHLVIVNKERRWWAERLQNGFVDLLEEEEQPVKVIWREQTILFNTGVDRKKIAAMMRELYREESHAC